MSGVFWRAGVFGTLIAAHAVSLGLAVIPKHIDHFTRFPGLAVMNWSS
jgi:predicted nucleic acid-binding protein